MGTQVGEFVVAAAELPAERVETLRDIVVGLAGALRHETRLRWAAEDARDEAEERAEKAHDEAEEHRTRGTRLTASLLAAHDREERLASLLPAANLTLKGAGLTPVGEEDLDELDRARFNRARYQAEGLGEEP